MHIFIHIGTDKTGSTAIQQHLSLNRTWFAERSIYIPTTGFSKEVGHAHVLRTLDINPLKKLTTELEQAAMLGFQCALLCWEGMSHYSPSQIKRLTDALPSQEISILVYLREQAELIQSGFLQQLKADSNNAPLHVFEQPKLGIEQLKSYRRRFPPSRNYYRLIRRWQRLLPGARMLVRIYDIEELVNGDIVDDFLTQLDLSTDDQFVRAPHSSRANLSLDVESGWLIDSWQRNGMSKEELLRKTDIALSIIAREGSGDHYFLSKQTVTDIRRHFRSSNLKLSRYYLSKQTGPFLMVKSCWRDCELDAFAERAAKLQQRIEEIDRTPTLGSESVISDTDIPVAVSLLEGWHAPENFGIWSSSKLSRLRFRVWYRQIKPNHGGIRVFIKGRYYGNNTSTSVTINNKDFGEVKLTDGEPGLELPIQLLAPFETIEICLRHSAPISPREFEGDKDTRTIAYAIQSIGYEYIRSAPDVPPLHPNLRARSTLKG